MPHAARTWSSLCALLIAASFVLLPSTLVAQEDGQEGPGTRITTVTSFKVPFQHRPQVMPFLMEQVIPATQLNPNVINFRVLLHNWGGDASDIHLVAEFADIADIESDCGQPCDDYYEANPAPEEGDEGYEDFQEAQELFNKYYSHHRDEIFVAPMMVAKVEGEMMGPVGGPEDEDGMEGEMDGQAEDQEGS